MKRKQIYDAFDTVRPDQAAKERMRSNILSQISDSQPAGKDVPMKKINKRRPLLAAAMIALALLLVGCAAVVVMNLSSLTISEETYVENAHYNEDGTKIPAEEKNRKVVSLQGIQGSNNQKAAQEWYVFEENYDPDGEKIIDDYLAPEEYSAYHVYNDEMLQKVKEICTKYSLKPAGAFLSMQHYQTDLFFEALGLENVHNENMASMEYLGGYFYACGNFNIEFNATLNNDVAQWNDPIIGNMRYNDKEYLDTLTVTVPDGATSWNYLLDDETDVLIVRFENWARIFCDREDAFLSVRFDTTNSSGASMTDRDIELVAESLDFSVKPVHPDMVWAKEQQLITEQEYQAEQQAMIESLEAQPWVDPFSHNSYAELIAYIPKNEKHFIAGFDKRYQDFKNNCSYMLLDLTGDGEDELVLGRDGEIITVWNMENGLTNGSSGEGTLSVCEGGIIEQYIFKNGEPTYYYFKIGAPENEIFIAYLAYSKYYESWVYMDYSVDTEATPISEEEAMKIIDSYAHIELNWKPVSEFPMN